MATKKNPAPPPVPARRPPGRPKSGVMTRRYNISLALDLAAYLDGQGSPSATITRALREMIERESRRK